MAILTDVARCDGLKCGRLKQESNRWWVLVRWPNRLEVHPYDQWVAAKRARRRDQNVRYYCGRACLLEAISGLLEELQT